VRCRCCRQVRDGQTARDGLIGRYCGRSLPPAITTTTRYLYFRFVADSVDQRNGFSLEYVANGKLPVCLIRPSCRSCAFLFYDMDYLFTPQQFEAKLASVYVYIKYRFKTMIAVVCGDRKTWEAFVTVLCSSSSSKIYNHGIHITQRRLAISTDGAKCAMNRFDGIC